MLLGVTSKKKNSIFKDIVQIGGGRSTPCQKFEKKWIFDKSWRGRGSQNILSKIEALYFVWFITLSIPLYPRSTLFCMINYSVCTLDPQKHTCTYIECESSIIDNTSWKMILSNIEFWRVEVDILKFHWNKLKIGNFQRFIWNILNHLLYFNLNQSFLVSFVHPGSTPHHFSSGLSLQSSEISGVTFDFSEKLCMCCAVLPMSILLRLR